MLLATDEEPETSLLSVSYWNKLLNACSSLQRNASEVAAMTLTRLAEFILYHLTIFEMVQYSFLSVAAVQSSNSTHQHYGIQPTQCPPWQPAELSSNSTHQHYGIQHTVSAVQPAAFRPEDRERRLF